MHFEARGEGRQAHLLEKPVAVDAPGVRRFLAANEEAKKKNLMVAVGLQRRHDPRYIETIKRLQDGAIGDILATRVYWNGGGLWVAIPQARADRDGVPDAQLVLLQLAVRRSHRRAAHPQHRRRQLAHSGMHPVEAQGMGGRQVRTGKEYGQIFDHHVVEFTYADGTKMFSQCRHIDGSWGAVSEHAHGTKGTADLDDGRGPVINGRTASGGATAAEGRQPPPGASRHVRRPAPRRNLQRRRLRRRVDDDGHPRPHGDLLRQDRSSGTKRSTRRSTCRPPTYDFAATPPVVPDADGYYPVPVPGKMNAMKA